MKKYLRSKRHIRAHKSVLIGRRNKRAPKFDMWIFDSRDSVQCVPLLEIDYSNATWSDYAGAVVWEKPGDVTFS